MVAVCFQDIAGQFNMAKSYFHGEMTMLKVMYLTECNLPTLYSDMKYVFYVFCVLRYIRLLSCQYR